MESYDSEPDSRRTGAFVVAPGLFVLLFCSTVDLPHSWLPLPAKWIAAPFDKAANQTAALVWNVANSDRSESDSPAMLAHTLNLLLVSFVLAVPLRNKLRPFVARWLPAVAAYLLAWQLLHYGFNKVFGWQFYRPEPNIQYSRIIDLSPDILYWTTMGTSRGYSLFLGSIELLAALLLFWRNTRLAGAMLAAAILVNVLAVNFSFGITVRLLSAFLLLLAGIAAWPDRARIGGLFGRKTSAESLHRSLCRGRKAFTALIMIILATDALYPYIRSGNFNDSAAPRPSLHGGYRVQFGSWPNPGWDRVFVHRQGYLIVQDSIGRFRDFTMTADTAALALWVSTERDSLEYRLDYRQPSKDRLHIRGRIGADSLDLELRKLPLRY